MKVIIWTFGGLILLFGLDKLTRVIFKENYNRELFSKVLGITVVVILVVTTLTRL